MAKRKVKKTLVAVRSAGILLGLFYLIFALDSNSVIEFLIHIIPGVLILGAVSLSWFCPRYAGLAFIVLGLVSIFFFHTYREVEMFLMLSVPLIVIGIFFYTVTMINK